MKWLIIILIVLLFLFLLIIISKITIYLNYYHHKDDDHLKIEFRLWFGLIRIKKTIPLIKIDHNSPSIIIKEKGNEGSKAKEDETVSKITKQNMITGLQNFKEILEHVFQLNAIIKSFLKKVSINRFEWNSIIGLGDAVYTGVAAGVIWTIKGSILGLASHYLRMKIMPKIMVQPNFQQLISNTELLCMFQFRIGYAMLAGIKLIKWWKGGLPHLKENKIISAQKTKSLA